MSGPVDQIPVLQPESMTHAFFVEWRQGRLDMNSYHVANAVWVTENTFKYPATPYVQISPSLKDYARARSQGQRERDPALHARLGHWVHGVMRTHNENLANLELLTWCLEKCKSAGMKGRAEALERKLGQFHAISLPTEMSSVLEAMKRDARDAQPKQGRGSAA